MTATFCLHTDELDASLVERIKILYPNQLSRISVSEADETDRIMANPELRERLLEAIDDIEDERCRDPGSKHFSVGA